MNECSIASEYSIVLIFSELKIYRLSFFKITENVLIKNQEKTCATISLRAIFTALYVQVFNFSVIFLEHSWIGLTEVSGLQLKTIHFETLVIRPHQRCEIYSKVSR